MNKLPIDYENRIRRQLADEADDFIKSFNEPYVKSLRINTNKNPEGILPGKITCADDTCRVNWEKKGIYYNEPTDNTQCGECTGVTKDHMILDSPGKSPLHAAGAYYIQEASAMLPVTMLDINNAEAGDEGLKVLDLCAAPGGKTTQIADYMAGTGLLVCNEIIPSRAKILSENIERMGVTNAVVISSDPKDLVGRFPVFFDRILVDAPCSGEGMFRKHNEAMVEWSLDNVKICADRQDMILDCAAKMLAPGGRIVYSTCTFSEEEDEGSIERFLNNHKEFMLLGESHRLFPHRDRGEGHFSAKLCRSSELDLKKSLDNKRKGKSKTTKVSIKKELEALYDFCNSTLNYCEVLGVASSSEKIDFAKAIPDEVINRIIMFGDRMFLTPNYMPSIDGLSVLRPGLHLGTVIKGRFEPSHAFALALSVSEAKLVADYDDTDGILLQYLKGMTISYEGQKGWIIVSVDGLSLGWGKLSGGIIKNHYPKGLRIMC